MYLLKTSINGVTICTINASLWRPLWPELMTYRRASRNASSNRVLRFGSQPSFLRPILTKQQKGMSVGERVDLETESRFFDDIDALYSHVLSVMKKYEGIVSRSILNRYLEPFTKINFVFTADSVCYEHIFNQRVFGENVEPNFRIFCEEIYNKYMSTKPKNARWHIPFFDDFEINDTASLTQAIMISAARCARTSYTPFGSSLRNISEDFELARRLIQDGHLTPFEHQLLSCGLVPKDVKPHPFIDGSVVSARQIIEKFNTIVLR